MSQKTIAITGANNGIGLATTIALAKQGHTLIMICRSQARGEAAQAKIATETGQTPNLLLADMSLQADVVAVAEQIKQSYAQLDVLINNAGTAFKKRRVTAEGFENTWALNHLGPLRLSLELLPLLKASAPARIVNVSSSAHKWGKLQFDNLQGERKFKGFGSYSLSKLVLLMCTYELARRLAGTAVTVNAHNPGAVATKRTDASRLDNWLMGLFRPFMRTTEQGAQNSITLATSPELEGVTGIYLEKEGEEAKSSPISYDQELTRKVWELSMAQMGINGDALLANNSQPT